MKTYLRIIKHLQTFFLGISIGTMLTLPLIVAFFPEVITESVSTNLYDISHLTIFFVMIVRPLADIFMGIPWIRPLVILRKGVGVLSASVAMSFIFAKIIMDPSGYLGSIVTIPYWSLENYALLGHLADISAVLLIGTSNNLSKRVLGAYWKKIQKLSYVFFYASSLYVYLSYGHVRIFVSMCIVAIVTLAAYFMNRHRAIQNLQETKMQYPQTI